MCGIFGIIGFNAAVAPDLLLRATNSLAHRGPDDSGTVLLRDPALPAIEIGLGSRRLAILDLSSSGHQPMHDPATGNWIVHNGEVYNFREIRTRLECAGFRFNSSSDTEVILKAYAHWGEDCLHEFRGMFAFAIWDARHHRLFVARDPMGIKPLYYYQSDRYFIFSSEVRTLLQTGLVPRRIDSAGLLNYLTFGSVCDPNTLIQNVTALRAAHFLTWQGGRVVEEEYFDLLDPTSEFTADSAPEQRDEVEANISAMLDEVVRMQLVSDVPLGVFLSGGIDSSALVGILHRNGIQPSTFSIVFRESEYSEAQHSRAVARHFHTDHHEITVSQSDLFAAIGPAVQAMDLPTIDGVNTYFVSQHTRAAGVKVALSGLGGDEMFAGYSSFRTVPRMERFTDLWKQVPSLASRPLASAFAAAAPSSDQNRKLTALAEDDESVIHPYFLSRMVFTPEQQSELLTARATHGVSGSEASARAEIPLLDSLNRAQHLDAINRVSYLESRSYMLNTLLRDSDSMSMAHGLEVRVPLIDHHLARRILALPGSSKLDSRKMDSRTPKPLLVRALGGTLPDSIVHRTKQGFTLPFDQWLREDLRGVMEDSLSAIGSSPLGSYINERAARRVFTDFLKGHTSWSRPWSLHVLESWCRLHLSN
ncbi:MAG: asparagine synthase (glutamine-hydrolyzing) [Candidatus Sulfotelmatobacter sp.]|jgi:asparagine synthase (glutamine-hydrolysing)